jgi:hypothetical protein
MAHTIRGPRIHSGESSDHDHSWRVLPQADGAARDRPRVYGCDVCPATYPPAEGHSEIRLTEAARS